MILSNQQGRCLQVRSLLGLSQEAFARELRVTQATVSRWEQRGTIHARHLARVEALLRERDQAAGPPVPILRLEAATLARAVLDDDPTMQARAKLVLRMCTRDYATGDIDVTG